MPDGEKYPCTVEVMAAEDEPPIVLFVGTESMALNAISHIRVRLRGPNGELLELPPGSEWHESPNYYECPKCHHGNQKLTQLPRFKVLFMRCEKCGRGWEPSSQDPEEGGTEA